MIKLLSIMSGTLILLPLLSACNPSTTGPEGDPTRPAGTAPGASRPPASQVSTAKSLGTVSQTTSSAPVAPKTVKVTWSGYDGLTDPSKAIYSLDGEVCGTVNDSFSVLIEKLRQLPDGSNVQIVTNYPPTGPSGPNRKLPFAPGFGSPGNSRYDQLCTLSETRHLHFTLDGRPIPLLPRDMFNP
jgi:hypothetical protein